MTLSLLGASIGDYISGSECYNNDIVIKLHSDVYPWNGEENIPPQYKLLDLARRYRKNFFSEMSDEEVLKWLQNKRVMGDGRGNKYIPDDTLVEVVKSKGEKSKLPPSKVSCIMTVGEIQEILDKPTLSFLYDSWDIIVFDFKINRSEVGNSLLIYKGNVVSVDKTDENAKFYKLVINDENIYLAGDNSDESFTSEIISERKLEDIYRTVKNCTTYYTPALYKSLLQKIIRVGPLYVDMIDNEGVSHSLKAPDVLMVTFVILYESKGSFVPDLGKFVSGRESAVKRLAVSIVEDSYIDDLFVVSDLLNDALIMQFDNQFGITKDKFNKYLDVAVKAQKDSRYFSYSTNLVGINLKYSEITKDPSSNNMCGFLLQKIGSFAGDISLMITAKTDLTIWRDKPPVEKWDIHRAIDQHARTDIAYMFPLDFVRKNVIKGANPYSEIMKFMWNYSSSYNPRKMETPNPKNWGLVGRIQEMYNLYYLKLYKKADEKRTITDESLVINYKIPESYISVKVGLHYNKGTMTCLNAGDIYTPSVTIIPSRDNKGDTSFVDPTVEEEVIKNFKKKLMKGVNGVVLQKDGSYLVDKKSVEEWVNRELPYKVCSLSNFNHDEDFIYDPVPLSLYSKEDPEKLIKEFSFGEINRAKFLINTGDEYITMPSISRAGGGVSQYEIGAYHLLNLLSAYYPLIIRQEKLGKFKIDPFLRDIFPKVSPSLMGTDIIPVDSLHRIPYSHQKEAIEELSANNNNFLWIPVGMGKTYIVISYIVKLLLENRANKYVLYTLPTSALESIVSEMKYWNIEVNIIKPTGGKSWVMKELIDGKKITVNLINHDHVRLIKDDLESYMENCLFVVDEVHKTLAETQRTMAVQTLASLSDKFVAMTGTPVINTKMSMLIGWLKMTVNFPINKNNFWIAISSMITHHVNTGVKVIQQEIFVPLNEVQKNLFNKYVGPNLGGSNSKVNMADIKNAMDVAYAATDEKMVNLIIDNIDDGVFVVTRNSEHQKRIFDLLIDEGISSKVIGLMTKDSLYNLVSVRDRGPKIIITTTSMSEGYTLTKLGVMVTSVYFSSLATRQQLEGRINRISQEREEIKYYVVLTSLLDLIWNNYKYVNSISSTMKMLTS